MGIGKSMSGTPWHAERVHRDGDEERRYKGRCKHYSMETNKCSKYLTSCIGSAHCDYYEAVSDEEFKERQKEMRKFKRKQPK